MEQDGGVGIFGFADLGQFLVGFCTQKLRFFCYFSVLRGLRVFSNLVFGFAKEFTPCSRPKTRVIPRDHLYSVPPLLQLNAFSSRRGITLRSFPPLKWNNNSNLYLHYSGTRKKGKKKYRKQNNRRFIIIYTSFELVYNSQNSKALKRPERLLVWPRL